MGYFAFVRRDAGRRYHATLPDFPGCVAEAEGIVPLADAIREAMWAEARRTGWPPPTRQEALPAPDDGHDGYWMMVELERDARR